MPIWPRRHPGRSDPGHAPAAVAVVPAAPVDDAGLPEPVAAFLGRHHVVGLAVADADGPWAASCFYVFDGADGSLVVLTDSDTRHGRAMAAGGPVAGTVAGQPERIVDIEGVQFTAHAERPAGEARAAALALYRHRHPAARLVEVTVWRLRLAAVKHTSNRLGFGRKTQWRRDG
jgi:uncharacterized protein YhbP (UPF0306 family)